MESNDPLIKGLATIIKFVANALNYVENKLVSCKQRIGGKHHTKENDYGNGEEFTEVTVYR
ncbi:hypothetical protein [Enterococcus casseliflavus]|uniref:hypothetical protein n=1 Tax=Enterococcus casseliflavus TaxID=37734 RepID=UPI00119FE2B0|nr:hypothetical protein [Enterococcus casseliflavus]